MNFKNKSGLPGAKLEHHALHLRMTTCELLPLPEALSMPPLPGELPPLLAGVLAAPLNPDDGLPLAVLALVVILEL